VLSLVCRSCDEFGVVKGQAECEWRPAALLRAGVAGRVQAQLARDLDSDEGWSSRQAGALETWICYHTSTNYN